MRVLAVVTFSLMALATFADADRNLRTNDAKLSAVHLGPHKGAKDDAHAHKKVAASTAAQLEAKYAQVLAAKRDHKKEAPSAKLDATRPHHDNKPLQRPVAKKPAQVEAKQVVNKPAKHVNAQKKPMKVEVKSAEKTPTNAKKSAKIEVKKTDKKHEKPAAKPRQLEAQKADKHVNAKHADTKKADKKHADAKKADKEHPVKIVEKKVDKKHENHAAKATKAKPEKHVVKAAHHEAKKSDKKKHEKHQQPAAKEAEKKAEQHAKKPVDHETDKKHAKENKAAKHDAKATKHN